MATFTVWTVTNRIEDDAGARALAVALAFPTPLGWSDLSEQVAVPTEPDVVVAHGRGLTAAQVDALEASAFPVLASEEEL